MLKHHFLSYSTIDALDFALDLHDAIEGGYPSIPLWMDKHDLQPGQDWDNQIPEAIRECASLIFIMTKDSLLDNSVCKNEWSRALKYKKPIVPIRLHAEAEMPFRLGSRQFIDFSTDSSAGLAKLRAHLKWLTSPKGKIQTLLDQLADARRDLQRAKGAMITHIQEEIDQLQHNIAIQNTKLQNRSSKDSPAQLNQIGDLNQEPNPLQDRRVSPGTRIINHPPVVVPTYFQNRQKEITLIEDFLKDDTKNLLNVVGRGGTGQTTLVCRVLQSQTDGQGSTEEGFQTIDRMVYLSSTGSHSASWLNLFTDLCRFLPEETAHALQQLASQPNANAYDIMQSLLEALPQGRTIVFLDNVQHIIDPETRNLIDQELEKALRALLDDGRSHLKFILTTHVAPKALTLVHPARQRSLHIQEGLKPPYTVNILRQMDTDGTVGLKTAPDALLEAAGERTRGFPRALEALYAILSADRETTLEEILADTSRLLPEHVLEVLAGEAFTRLDSLGKRVVQALAIMDAPISPIAINYLLEPYLPGLDSEPILKRLLNMQFVRKQGGNFFLHAVDREYAFSRIPHDQQNEQETNNPPFTQRALFHRAANFYRDIRKPQVQWNTLDDLTPQMREFDLRCHGKEYETALRLLMTFDFDYLLRWGHYRLMANLHERVHDQIQDRKLEQQHLANLGTAYYRMGDLSKAIHYHEEALTLAHQNQDQSGESIALGNLGLCYRGLGKTLEAIENYEAALPILRTLSLQDAVATILMNLGTAYSALGRIRQGVTVLEEANAIYLETGNQNNRAMALVCLGEVQAHLGNTQSAGQYTSEGLALARTMANPFVEAAALCIRGELERDTQNWDAAIVSFQEAIQKADFIGNAEIRSIARTRLCMVFLLSDNLIDARETIEDALHIEAPSEKHVVSAMYGIVSLRQGHHKQAKQQFLQTITQTETLLNHCSQDIWALESKALAQCGLAICDQNPELTSSAIETFKIVREMVQDKGTLQRILKLLQALSLADTHGILTEELHLAASTESYREKASRAEEII
ncbi:MAG: TIR domain-containing protein [Nitrospirales bacterium]